MCAAVFATVAAQAPFHLLPLDRALPPRADAIYQQLATSVDPAVAMDTARMMAPLWRLAGNPAFEQSQQFVFDRLAAAGLTPRYESFTNSGMGWEHSRGTLRLGGAAGRRSTVCVDFRCEAGQSSVDFRSQISDCRLISDLRSEI